MTPTTEARLIMRPDFCRTMILEIALVQLKALFRLTLMTASQSSSFMRIIKPSRVIPALFTSTSICPYRSITVSTQSDTDALSATSTCVKEASGPNSFAVASPASVLTSQIATLAPCLAKFSAVTFPIPAAPPVTMTTFFSNRKRSSLYTPLERLSLKWGMA